MKIIVKVVHEPEKKFPVLCVTELTAEQEAKVDRWIKSKTGHTAYIIRHV